MTGEVTVTHVRRVLSSPGQLGNVAEVVEGVGVEGDLDPLLLPITTASELTLWVGRACSPCSGQLAVQPVYFTVAPYFLHFLPFISLVQDRIRYSRRACRLV